MTPLAWFIAADTVVTALAVLLALAAWRRPNRYMGECRATVQAYAPLAKAAIAQRLPTRSQHADNLAHVESYVTSGATTWGDLLQLLAEEYPPAPEQTRPVPLVDEHPTGRHAYVEPVIDVDDVDDPCRCLVPPSGSRNAAIYHPRCPEHGPQLAAVRDRRRLDDTSLMPAHGELPPTGDHR